MKTTHTPGPWETSVLPSSDPEWSVCEPDGGDTIAFISSDRCDPETRAANARLIAAAPRLLTALKRIAAREDERGDWPDSGTEREVREAIQQATGEA